MQITKLVSIGEIEAQVSVSIEDIVQALDECHESNHHILNGVNNCAQFLKAISGDRIMQMSESSRGVISTFLSEQSIRFKP